MELCGDGIDLLEYECDDGNRINGDGCSSECVLEAGYVCEGGDQHKPDTCYEICGNGRTIKRKDRMCDDGNIFDNDGCSSNCIVEPGYECFQDSKGKDECQEICGDGIKIDTANKNLCDDGNTFDGDGCNS